MEGTTNAGIIRSRRFGTLTQGKRLGDCSVGLRIIQWSVISALAGFLFGFDTVVISGAEQKIQTLWGLSPAMHGIVIASALYGTVLGSLFGGYPADRFGRRATLIGIGFLYLIGAIGSAAANG